MQSNKRKIHQMLTAVIMMKGKSSKNSKLYENARLKFSKMHSESISGENHPMYGISRFGEENPFFGKTHSKETRKKLSECRSGMIVAKDNRDGSKLWVKKEDFEKFDYYVGLTSGTTISDATKEKISKTLKEKPYRTCPHCGKVGKGGNMTRYHFDNCSIAKL
jgi:hypothetical protein